MVTCRMTCQCCRPLPNSDLWAPERFCADIAAERWQCHLKDNSINVCGSPMRATFEADDSFDNYNVGISWIDKRHDLSSLELIFSGRPVVEDHIVGLVFVLIERGLHRKAVHFGHHRDAICHSDDTGECAGERLERWPEFATKSVHFVQLKSGRVLDKPKRSRSEDNWLSGRLSGQRWNRWNRCNWRQHWQFKLDSLLSQCLRWLSIRITDKHFMSFTRELTTKPIIKVNWVEKCLRLLCIA